MNGAKIFSINRSAGWFKNKQANKQKKPGLITHDVDTHKHLKT